MEFIWQAIRQVVFLLDQAVYSLIPSAYELIFYLANINLATNDIFVAVINRIYLLLGIFMLFKVSFSIMQYIVDPNAFSDKSKGFGKLVTNSLVSVVLLALVPWIFATAYDLQSKIILSNVIPRVILGDASYADNADNADVEDSKQKQKDIHSLGVDVQFTIFSAFYNLNTTSNGGYESCAPTSDHPTSNVIGSSDMIKTCWSEVEGPLTEEIHKQGGTLRGLFKYCNDASCSDGVQDERDFATFKYLLWWMKDGGQSNFTISYIPIISSIVGGYLLILLITFAIDIAVRVFKLMFLQMAAPIAIISYIDPKESASNGRLHNWIMECVKTYVSLFLRLAVIYLAIQIIKLLTITVFAPLANFGTGTNNYSGLDGLYYNGVAPEGALNIFVYIFLVLGIFTFAKKLPQIIESIFNIKLSGELHLNPFKNEGPAGALLGGAVGLAAGTVAGARAFKDTRDIRALGAGMVSGTHFGVQNRGKNGLLGGAMSNAYKDITGNEMVRMTTSSAIMGIGAKGRINRLNDLNSVNSKEKSRLTGQYSDAQRRRNNAVDRAQKAEAAAGLTYNINDNMSSEERERIVRETRAQARTQAENDMNAAIASYGSVENLTSELEKARSRVQIAQQRVQTAGSNAAARNHAQANLNSAMSQLSKLEADRNMYQQANSRINAIDELFTSEQALADAARQEETLRKQLASVDKDAEALKQEAKEIARRSHIDTSPYKNTTAPAIKRTEGRK